MKKKKGTKNAAATSVTSPLKQSNNVLQQKSPLQITEVRHVWFQKHDLNLLLTSPVPQVSAASLSPAERLYSRTARPNNSSFSTSCQSGLRAACSMQKRDQQYPEETKTQAGINSCHNYLTLPTLQLLQVLQASVPPTIPVPLVLLSACYSAGII